MVKRTSKAFAATEYTSLPKAIRQGKRLIPLVKSAPSQSVPDKIKRYVKREINKGEETFCSKKNIFNQNNTVGYGLNNDTGLGLTSYSYTPSIIPLVTLGDEENQRTGSQIQTKQLRVRFALRAIDVNSTTNANAFKPFMVKVIIYNRKPNIYQPSNVGILRDGSGTAQFGSAPETWLEPYNKDMFNIFYSKSFNMVPARKITGNAAPNEFTNDAIISGYKSFIMKSVSIKLPKKLLYDNATQPIANKDLPTNACLQMAVCVCNHNGDANTTDQRLMVNADSFLYYKDS